MATKNTTSYNRIKSTGCNHKQEESDRARYEKEYGRTKEHDTGRPEEDWS